MIKYLTALILFLPIICFSNEIYLNELVSRADITDLHKDPYWHRLVHYKPNLLRGYTSQVTSLKFFNSPEGRTNPKEELLETIKAFFKNPETLKKGEEHPKCNFLTRFKWLKKKLNINEMKLPDVRCKRFDKWFKKLNIDSISMIFASYYINNPASAFGHTFLRLNSKGWRNKVKLINYGVNFGADISDETNAIYYALGGIFGWFPGSFTIFPYYMKVKSYSDIEWRDIWEYKLNFTKDEIHTLLTHLWELGGQTYDYYFFKENCSYHMLSVLEVMKPELDLLKNFWAAWVIPAQTIKVLFENNLVTGKEYRPSLVSKFKHRYSILNEDERVRFHHLRNDKLNINSKSFSALKDSKKAKVVDAYLDYLRYEASIKKSESFEKLQAKKQELYLERSKWKKAETPKIIPPEESSPEHGHGVGKLALAGGIEDDHFYDELGFWFAYHDLLAKSSGYDPTSHMVLMDTKIRAYYKKKKIKLKEINIAEVKTLTPFDMVTTPMSWKFHLKYERFYGVKDKTPLAFKGNYGFGLSLKVDFLLPILFYSFIDTDIFISNKIPKRFRFGLGNSTGILFDISKDIRAHLWGSYLYFPLGYTGDLYRINTEIRYSISKNIDSRLILKGETNHYDASLVFNFFY